MPSKESGGVLIRVGRQISNLRESANMTPGELARRLRIKKEDVLKIEKGQYKLFLSTLFKIAKVFGRHLEVRFANRR